MIVAAACADREAPRDGAAAASNDRASHATSPFLHPDSFAALLAFDRPLADSMHACLPLVSLPPPPDAGSIVQHLRTGDRYGCAYEPGTGTGTGGMAGLIHRASIHCWSGGRLIEFYREGQDWHEGGFFLRETRFRQAGEDSLRLIRVDAVREAEGGRNP